MTEHVKLTKELELRQNNRDALRFLLLVGVLPAATGADTVKCVGDRRVRGPATAWFKGMRDTKWFGVRTRLRRPVRGESRLLGTSGTDVWQGDDVRGRPHLTPEHARLRPMTSLFVRSCVVPSHK